MKLPQVNLPKADLDRTGLPERFMNPGELETLAWMVASVNPATVIEFGVNEGRTAKALLRHVPTIRKYIGIDVLPGYVPVKAVQRDEVPVSPGRLAFDEKAFELIVRKRGSLDLVPDDLPQFDVAFIDGDHGRAGVEHDTALAKARVKPGGLIIWHDYHDLGTVDVREVLNEMHVAGADIKHAAGTWLAFMKA